MLVVAILLLLAILTGPVVRGANISSGFSLNIQPGASQVAFSVSIFQNVTAIVGSFVLPQTDSVLVGYNSTTAAATLQSAIQARTPSANLKSLRLHAVSTPWSNSTQVQWLNISLSFGIEESSRSNDQSVHFDAAWRSFAVSSSVSLAGFEANNIGSAYLVGAAEALQGIKNSKTIVFTYHLNGRGVPIADLPEKAATVSVLNFSSLAIPLSNWIPAYNYTTNSVTWSLKSLPTYTFDVTETVTEAQPTQIHYQLSYSFHMASITAPLRSSFIGDTIFVVFGDTTETFMGLIIASASLVAVGTTFYERRVLSRVLGKRTRR